MTSTVTILSTGAPITLIEALAPGSEATPRLGRIGVAVTGLYYLGGNLLIGWDNWAQDHFCPSPGQVASALVTSLLVVWAVRRRRNRPDLPA